MAQMAVSADLYKTEAGRREISTWYDGLVARVGCELESGYVPTSCGSTHYLACGPDDAPPLVLIQGVAGSAPLWHQQFPALSRSTRVYALDTPGQPGRSDPVPLSFFDTSYVTWLCEALDGLGLASAHIGGICSGGWAVMQLGIMWPARVRSAILISPMGLARARLPLGQWLPGLKNFIRKDRGGRSLEDRLTARSFVPGTNRVKPDPQLARAYALATRHFRVGRSLGLTPDLSPARRLARACGLVAKFTVPESGARLRRFRNPALVVVGEHEILFNPWRAERRMRRLLPNMRFDIVPQAGHAAVYDRAAYVNAHILAFIQEVEASRDTVA